MEPRSSSSSSSSALAAAALLLASSLLLAARADDPYRFYTWNVTFGDIYPLGVKQEVRAPRLVPFVAALLLLLMLCSRERRRAIIHLHLLMAVS